MHTVISIKTDTETKDAAKEVATSAGLTLSALVNSYLRHVAATRRIEIYAPEPMTPKLEKFIAEVEAEVEDGKMSSKYSTHKQFFAALDK